MSSSELAIFYQHSLRVTDSWGLYPGSDLQSHKPHLLHRLQLHKSYVDKKTKQCVSWLKKKGGAKFHLPHPHTCCETLSSYTEGVLPAFVALQIQREARLRSRGGCETASYRASLCGTRLWLCQPVTGSLLHGGMYWTKWRASKRNAVYLRCTWCTSEEAGAE